MEPFLGMIATFGFNFAPYSWAFCNGQAVSVAQNSALYALLGTTYGYNQLNVDFKLPDLRGRVVIGMGQGPNLPNYTIGQYSGNESITLSAANTPPHTHAATLANASATIKAYSGTGTATAPNSRSNTTVLSGSTVNLYGSTAPDTVMSVGGGAVTGTVTIGATPAGTPFSIMQPYLPINFCIATSGIFPSRN